MIPVERLFLDANVLFSAAYGSRRLALIWDRAREGRCHLLASLYVVEEARRNLGSPEQRDRLGGYLGGIEIVPEAAPDLACPIDLPDKDRPVLLAAIAAGATHLITGDMRHFGTYYGRVVNGLAILSPADYLSNK